MRVRLFVAALILLAAPASRANEIYSYVGNPFRYCSGIFVSDFNGICKQQYAITGSFTTSLDPFHVQGLTDFTIPMSDIVSFSFGVSNSDVVIDQLNGAGRFEISTDDQGHILSSLSSGKINWDLSLAGPTEIMRIQSCREPGVCLGGEDYVQSGPFPPGGNDYGQTAFTNVGTWSDSPSADSAPAPTPEPGTLVLFGSSLLILLALGRRTREGRNASSSLLLVW